MRSVSIQAEQQENLRRIKFSTESSKTNLNVPGLVPGPVVQFNVLGPNQWLIDPAAPQIPPPPQHIPPPAPQIPPPAQNIPPLAPHISPPVLSHPPIIKIENQGNFEHYRYLIK